VEAQPAVIRIAAEYRTEYGVITHRDCQELRSARQLGVASFSELNHGTSKEETRRPGRGDTIMPTSMRDTNALRAVIIIFVRFNRAPKKSIIREIIFHLTESRRRAIFATIVNSQDQGASVRQSRRLAAARFDVSWEQIVAIEREGLVNGWPPLPPRLACSVAGGQ
jgi:hypothetical protein